VAAGGKREKVISFLDLLQFTPLPQWIVILIENMNISPPTYNSLRYVVKPFMHYSKTWSRRWIALLYYLLPATRTDLWPIYGNIKALHIYCDKYQHFSSCTN